MWEVEFADEFDAEFDDLEPDIQDELLAHLSIVRRFGPQAGRPRVDTLNGSSHANMKELRFSAGGGEWRAAFDPHRKAIVLVAGDKSEQGSEARFYRALVKKADARFKAHLKRLTARRR